ncbi:MAG: hypothetical protein ACPH5G_13125 [Pseudooceanicola atlanticus]
MDSDLILVVGIVILMLSIPSALSAFADGRAPWVALLVIILGGAVVGWAWVNHPGGYTLEDVPHAIIRVVARVIP